MKHYKSESGEVFAFELDGSQDEYIPEGAKKMTAKQVEAHINPLPTIEQLKAAERSWRDIELSRADVQLNKLQDGANVPGTVGDWRKYRQALRDWPDAEAFPSVDMRPVAPDAGK